MSLLVGIDEVGRGCWAGPLLVVAAKATADLPVGLKDSKLLSKKQRSALFESIKLSCELGEGWVQPAEIDKLGLTAAMTLGVSRAMTMLGVDIDDEIIMDGSINYCPPEFYRVITVIQADSLHPIVSAASIYAKVMRDKYMAAAAKTYPIYQFDKHVGYGTKKHIEMLQKYGSCKIHRLSYTPLKALII